MHIYAFGSVCRGDVSLDSDVDLLAVVDGYDARFDPNVYSIYSYKRIKEIWQDGSPFAWHLSLESKPLFLGNNVDYLAGLGRPGPYGFCARDCEKFYMLFCDARASLLSTKRSIVFDLSTIFLSIRNIATCFSLGATEQPDFSRHSALRLKGHGLQISSDAYRVFERARLLCTRGKGKSLTDNDIELAIDNFEPIYEWMAQLSMEAKRYERI